VSGSAAAGGQDRAERYPQDSVRTG